MDTQSANNARDLKEIVVAKENPTFISMGGILLTKDKAQILHYPIKHPAKSFTIPKEVTSLDTKETFTNGNLEALEVEKGNANYSSFDGAVYSKDQIELLIIPNGKKAIQVLGTVVSSPQDLSPFNSKGTLENVAFDEGITSLPADLFVGCHSLKTITMPKSLTTIDNFTFNEAQLNSITIIGHKNTVAERFAKEHNVKFQAIVNKEFEALQAKINEANTIDTSKYTEASVKAFNEALTNAKTLTADSSKDRIVKAHDELEKAIKELVKKTSNPQTGDASIIGLPMSMMALSGSLSFELNKKKKKIVIFSPS